MDITNTSSSRCGTLNGVEDEVLALKYIITNLGNLNAQAVFKIELIRSLE